VQRGGSGEHEQEWCTDTCGCASLQVRLCKRTAAELECPPLLTLQHWVNPGLTLG
jgi:hypothetical protein